MATEVGGARGIGSTCGCGKMNHPQKILRSEMLWHPPVCFFYAHSTPLGSLDISFGPGHLPFVIFRLPVFRLSVYSSLPSHTLADFDDLICTAIHFETLLTSPQFLRSIEALVVCSFFRFTSVEVDSQSTTQAAQKRINTDIEQQVKEYTEAYLSDPGSWKIIRRMLGI